MNSAIQIDPEFQALIPPLTSEEHRQLEANLLADGCRDPIVTWKGILLDGHNRKEICDRLDIAYRVTTLEVTDRQAAQIWIIRNQFGRRNLQPFQRAELALKLEPLISAKAKENQGTRTDIYQNSDRSSKATLPELAKISGLSHDTIHKAKAISERAPEEIKQRLRCGETSIDREYQQLKKSERKEEVVEEIRMSAPLGKFHVLVVDPPWPMQKIEREVAPNQSGFDYPTLSIDAIVDYRFEGRSIPDIASEHAHLFLWTTQRFLPNAFDILDRWGFQYIFMMVWHKAGGFQPFGLPQYNCEFVLYGRKGSASFEDTKQFSCCFEAPRQEHSRKPDAFYELVRRVTLEPRIDIFSRETHDGFVQLGNQIEKF